MKWFDNLCIRLWVWIETEMFFLRREVEKVKNERVGR